jgi:hypothetical protein
VRRALVGVRSYQSSLVTSPFDDSRLLIGDLLRVATGPGR